jgi:hypothetical protein
MEKKRRKKDHDDETFAFGELCRATILVIVLLAFPFYSYRTRRRLRRSKRWMVAVRASLTGNLRVMLNAR